MSTFKHKFWFITCIGGIFIFLIAIFVVGYHEKKERVIGDIVASPDAVSIIAYSVSKRPGAITGLIIGTIDSGEVSALNGAARDVGPWGQIAEFDLTEYLIFQGIPESISKEFGKFPFPSEYRTWEGKVAGFDAKLELYFDPRTRKFAIYIWNR